MEQQAEEPSLYEKIGGAAALTALLGRFYDLVYAHERIGRLFTGDKELIKHKQQLFLTQFLGGPAAYTHEYGHPRMRARHMPHQISQEDAMGWLECMAGAIKEMPITEALKDELFDRFPRTAFFMVNS